MNYELQTIAVQIEKEIVQKIKEINREKGRTITWLIRTLLIREIEENKKDA